MSGLSTVKTGFFFLFTLAKCIGVDLALNVFLLKKVEKGMVFQVTEL